MKNDKPLFYETLPDDWCVSADAKEVELSIESLLANHLSVYKMPEYKSYIKDEKGYNRGISGLQKAIRRGNVEVAQKVATAISNFSEKHNEKLWRRLCTIAIEDIGVGNIVIVAIVNWVAGKKKFKASIGGDMKVLMWCIEVLCQSEKDRTACDLLVWADLEPKFQEIRDKSTEFWEKPLDEDVDITKHMHEALGEPHLAVSVAKIWGLLGTKQFPGARFKPEIEGMGINGWISYLRNTYVGAVPEIILKTMRWSMSKQYEGMAMTYPIVFLLMKQTPKIECQKDELIDMGFVGQWPSCTFDMHTTQGRAAIRKFATDCKPIKELMEYVVGANQHMLGTFAGYVGDKFIDEAFIIKEALGTIIFRLEGHQVDRRLVFNGSDDILASAEMAHLQGNFIPLDLCEPAMSLVRVNMDHLHWCRQKICLATHPTDPVGPEPFSLHQPHLIPSHYNKGSKSVDPF